MIAPEVMSRFSDLFETAIREQVEIAVDEADVILFIVDAKQGLSPLDSDIANLLRGTNKKTIVVIVDLLNDEPNAGNFFKLGINEVYDISAKAGKKNRRPSGMLL